MLRLLVSPRWLGASLLVLVGFPICVALGLWQWERANQPARVLTAEEEYAVPLADVLDGRPADLVFPTGLLVRATGTYDGERLVVRGVDADGATARWTVTGLVADAGGLLATVRGRALPPPSEPVAGDVVLTGRLQPPAAPTVTDGLDRAALGENGFDPRGYLVLVDQQPPDAVAAAAVEAVPPPPSSPGRRWQNSMYAVQWWFFGGFLVFAWVRFFREDLRAARAESGLPSPAPRGSLSA